jgi:Holliday junction DNA helicase RuvA
MIAHLSGDLLRKSTQSIIIDNGGIGYEVFIPLSTFYNLPEKDERVSLHIYTHVREDALTLFGFQTPLEKDLFMMLISVSGIGPKLAINILSGIGPEDLLVAMAQGDTLRLQSIPGVGRKTAERIALELRDKAVGIKGEWEVPLTKAMSDEEKTMIDDALSALLNLGYASKSARVAVQKAISLMKDVSLEGLIREALKILA